MTTEARLENLERELLAAKRHNRRLLIGAVTCLGVIFAWAIFAQPARLGTAQAEGTTTAKANVPATAPAQNEVRAKSFILEDDNGKTRATLGLGENGPRLRLFDEKGTPRAMLGISANGPALIMVDENGKARITLATFKDGPAVDLRDEKGDTCASLRMSKDGGEIVLHDENGVIRAILGGGKDKGLKLCDEKGKLHATLGSSKHMMALNLMDDSGTGRTVSLGANKDAVWLLATDDNGNVRAYWGVNQTGPEMNLVEADGHVIWNASEPVAKSTTSSSAPSTHPASESPKP